MKKFNSILAIAAVALTSVFTSVLTSGDASGSGKVETKTSSTFKVMPVDFSQAFVM